MSETLGSVGMLKDAPKPENAGTAPRASRCRSNCNFQEQCFTGSRRILSAASRISSLFRGHMALRPGRKDKMIRGQNYQRDFEQEQTEPTELNGGGFIS